MSVCTLYFANFTLSKLFSDFEHFLQLKRCFSPFSNKVHKVYGLFLCFSMVTSSSFRTLILINVIGLPCNFYMLLIIINQPRHKWWNTDPHFCFCALTKLFLHYGPWKKYFKIPFFFFKHNANNGFHLNILQYTSLGKLDE